MVNPINSSIPGYPGADGVGDLALTTRQSGSGGGNADLPPVDEETLASFQDALPKLLPPLLAGNISLEELVKAIGMETRQVATKTGLETLKAKAAETEEANQKKIEEIQKQVEKLRKLAKLGPLGKVFKWIAMLVAAIAAAAATVVAAATANPLLIAGAAIMIAMVVNSMASEASGGKVSIGAGVAELAKQCGASEEVAQWIGMGVEIGVTLVGVALTFGAGLSSTVSTATETAGKVAQIAARVSQAASLASGVTTMTQGGLGIADAVYTSGITRSKAAQKDLEAILARISEAQDIETHFLESVMKRAEELLSDVREIVQGNLEAQAAILGGKTPAVA
ncbi:MAG: type III secretion system translocon subunit SctE [Zoogloeaceae bacterium]|jgi:hypothetical protein|nr:type III secretion system translocon subunit SctE [Zoogloeaceae bacterium]